ncbi:hypothetical protein LZ198_33395 [Myxococcus sp. K15C18031901]|uniref:hypothetical protein n=1 Tax=Myxococcus dinghuensis TaxID=2906761 RepID=UPI0020A824C1|nr:hypothetical protein [Myxococcus dinghuensis]MCP3103791.1 hypothetical protein [Myxococcus dinghuensis]
MRSRFLLSVVLLVSTTGCPFRGYQSTPAADALWAVPSAGASDVSVYFYQPKAKDVTALKEGLTEVRAIFADEAFRGLVREASGWIVGVETCKGMTEPVEYATDGEAVVTNVLARSFVGVHYLVNRHFGAIATTNLGRHGTAFNPWQVEKWRDSKVSTRAEFINTLAHELTHLVPEPHDDRCVFSDAARTRCDKYHGERFRYTDSDHTRCTERQLVSYRLGDMTGCYYELRQQGQRVDTKEGRASFDACMVAAREMAPDAERECEQTLRHARSLCRSPSP